MKVIVRQPSAREIKIASTWPVWEKEVSSFPWEYGEKETCLIVEGKATVTTNKGEKISFGAGDLVVFPEGLVCTWDITEKLKKHYNFGD